MQLLNHLYISLGTLIITKIINKTVLKITWFNIEGILHDHKNCAWYIPGIALQLRTMHGIYDESPSLPYKECILFGKMLHRHSLPLTPFWCYKQLTKPPLSPVFLKLVRGWKWGGWFWGKLIGSEKGQHRRRRPACMAGRWHSFSPLKFIMPSIGQTKKSGRSLQGSLSR